MLEATTTSAPPSDPKQVYQDRHQHYLHALKSWESLHRRVAHARLATFLIGLFLLWLAWGPGWLSYAWLSFPILTFIGLLFWHEALAQRRLASERCVTYYSQGLVRLDHHWQGQGRDGAAFQDTQHLYAADLDLFGQGSLFERLCTCHTSLGEAALAQWLLRPADRATVMARQVAVMELTPQLALREKWVHLAGNLKDNIQVQPLYAWVKEMGWPSTHWLRVGMESCIFVSVITLVGCAANWWPWSLLFWAFALQGAFAWRYSKSIRRILAQVEPMNRELSVLTQLFHNLGSLPCHSPWLRELQAQLKGNSRDAAQAIEQLSDLVDRLAWRNNAMFAPVGLFLLWGLRHAFAIDAWRQQHRESLPGWLQALGQFEALQALATYAFENSKDVFPELLEVGPHLEGRDLRHPLLPREVCIPNDVQMKARSRLLIVSGSNMSGKSTFLRTIGINVVLSWCGAPVRATEFRLSRWHVGATLRIQDSLHAGLSRFYAEVHRLKQIIDLAEKQPVLFLLDELLHGTNSHDRRVGASGILRGLLERGSIGLATTHDLALAELANELPDAHNVHFADRWDGGSLEFDYKMRPGVVRHSNALSLMRAVGLDL